MELQCAAKFENHSHREIRVETDTKEEEATEMFHVRGEGGSGQGGESCQTSLGIRITRGFQSHVKGGAPSTHPPEIQIKPRHLDFPKVLMVGLTQVV